MVEDSMRKWVIALSLAFALAGCSQGDKGNSEDAVDETEGKAEETMVYQDVVRGDELPDVVEPGPEVVDVVDLNDAPDLATDALDAADTPLPPDVLDIAAEPDLSDAVDAVGPDLEESDGADEVEVFEQEVEEVVEPPFEYAWESDQPCGMAPYDWLMPEEVGHVVDYEEKLLYNMTPEMIKLLVDEAGYNLVFDLPYGSRVFIMRYTTQDRGVVREATAMVGLPDVHPEDVDGLLSLPVTSFLHGTAGFADKCAPSLGLEGAAAAILPAASGMIAVAPDFLGLCGYGEPCDDMFHPYLIGEPTALASLDAVRAALELLELLQEEIPVAADGRLMPWGVSQGGHAALFLHRYAQFYAPEYEIPCLVAVVPPANLIGQAAVALDGFGPASGMGLGFMLASYLWYEPAEGLDTLLNPDGPKNYPEYSLETFHATCSSGKLYKGAATLEDLYTGDFLTTVATEGFASYLPWGCFGLENSVPSASVPAPEPVTDILWVMGENDEIVNTPVARGTLQTLCGQGYRLQHLECAGKKHTPAALDSFSLQLEWALECLDGTGIAEENLCVLQEPVECKL